MRPTATREKKSRGNATCSQHVGETIDQYATDLRMKAKSCEFGLLIETLIKDRIVCGIIDDGTRSRLLRENDLSLSKALDILCRENEATSVQMKQLTAAPKELTEPEEVCTVVKRSKTQYNRQREQCGRCGNWHNRQQSCPAIGVECHKCGRKKHFSRMCRSNSKKPNVRTITSDNPNEDEEMFVATMHRDKPEHRDWQATLTINEKKVFFKIDTGAQCNVISKRTYHQISKTPLKKSNTKLVAFGGHKLMACEYKGKYTLAEFEVVEQDVPDILGLPSCTQIKSIQQTPEYIFQYFKDVFNGLGCIKGTRHRIRINQNHTPVIHPPRKIPVMLRKKVKDELKRMEQLDVVERVHAPTDWVNNMVIVTKPNGKLRICIDPRDLNRAIKREHYPMKTIEEVVTPMPNTKIFSVLDASSGFWQ